MTITVWKLWDTTLVRFSTEPPPPPPHPFLFFRPDLHCRPGAADGGVNDGRLEGDLWRMGRVGGRVLDRENVVAALVGRPTGAPYHHPPHLQTRLPTRLQMWVRTCGSLARHSNAPGVTRACMVQAVTPPPPLTHSLAIDIAIVHPRVPRRRTARPPPPPPSASPPGGPSTAASVRPPWPAAPDRRNLRTIASNKGNDHED